MILKIIDYINRFMYLILFGLITIVLASSREAFSTLDGWIIAILLSVLGMMLTNLLDRKEVKK